ncbi:hypothetical protein E1286_22045 [Nonomuraea terrae]|uniref:Uncharacterized protein n=1 Tax=Nonomuraea terrae TaxID=2530383 RepID=A0A4R4YM96_9ACTN|nr:DUF6297 family protein [Nonomuraea terrae]TDD46086.1 hypothetical protein E1286_22045 [Nonomuraea terrae]
MNRVQEVRTYLRSRRRGSAGLADRYVAVFGIAMIVAVAGQPVSGVLAGLAAPVDPARVGAGAALLAVAVAGFLAAARMAGPLFVAPADASWLLLTPLHRRSLLSRTARMLGLVALVAGLLLGVALLAVLGAPDQLVWRVLGALVLGVSATVGGMALAVLGQSSQTWQFWLAATVAALLVVAVVAVSGQLRTVLAVAAGAPLTAVAAAVAGAVAVSAMLAGRAWMSLDRIPSRDLVTASTRAGHVADATVGLDPSVFTWIAEDTHWRSRTLVSRRWPKPPAPPALAWTEWVRVARRPGRLAVIAAAAPLPAVLVQAGASPAAFGFAVLGGALAVAATAVSGARRDADNPALARLMGVGLRPGLAARAALPALLSGAWAAAALALNVPDGGAVMWWVFGPLMAPALAAGALRMARRRPIDHSLPVIETGAGAVPTGVLLWAVAGADLAALGCLPALTALTSPSADLGPYLLAQGVTGVAVLLGYLWRARAAKG